MTTCV